METNIENCLKLASAIACEKCLPNYKIATNSEGNNICEALNNDSCREWDGEKCKKCENGYFVDSNTDNGKCTSPTTSVDNCLGYSDGETCS